MSSPRKAKTAAKRKAKSDAYASRSKRGRPLISLSLSVETLDALDALCASLDVNRGEALSWLLAKEAPTKPDRKTLGKWPIRALRTAIGPLASFPVTVSGLGHSSLTSRTVVQLRAALESVVHVSALLDVLDDYELWPSRAPSPTKTTDGL